MDVGVAAGVGVAVGAGDVDVGVVVGVGLRVGEGVTGGPGVGVVVAVGAGPPPPHAATVAAIKDTRARIRLCLKYSGSSLQGQIAHSGLGGASYRRCFYTARPPSMPITWPVM